MRNLVVRVGFGIKHHNRIWSPTRCSNLIKRFESLQGLTLLIGFVVDDDSNYTGMMTYGSGPKATVIRGSRLEGIEWDEEKNWFPVFLRSFQQHHLQGCLTRVTLFDRCKAREDPYSKDRSHREDGAIQETRRLELAASMRSVLLNQTVSHLFPDWEAENRRLLEEDC